MFDSDLMVNVVPVQSFSDETLAKEWIKNKREPFILKNFDYGPCLQKWNAEYMMEKVNNKTVKIHVSSKSEMDFINKNFLYRTLPFKELIKRASQNKQTDFFIDENEKYYLRSLGADDRKDVADIQKDYPELSNEIRYPPLFELENFFSSVFRISSAGLRLWTHYDIMDNILIQINGKKRVVLFPPSDVDNLYMKGDKSQVLEIDNPDLSKYPLFAHAKKYECILEAGDVIFIPSLWLHNVISVSFSIGVNVFWKHLDDEFYEKKDVYGNKDLVAAQKAFLFADKAINELNRLPLHYKEFYIKRVIQKFQKNLDDE
ncbi:tRNA wybutosine-synthesizing 5 [Brachionus plicatilis]|uniref:tRNA wybutosine-synthesizing 5 n=1 Tax=Brachionus plicatilis TaxID=10195 RepID=A0A3M7PQF9_BRAPC|nr:tRNA wybutosine-synthesizing 5 [Brachionus plicatilis]